MMLLHVVHLLCKYCSYAQLLFNDAHASLQSYNVMMETAHVKSCCIMLYTCCASIVHMRSCCTLMCMLRYNVTILRWWQHMSNHVASWCIVWERSYYTCTLGRQWCNMYNSCKNVLHWCLHMLSNVTTLSQCKITCFSIIYNCLTVTTYIITCCMLCCHESTTIQHVRWCRPCQITYVHMSWMSDDDVRHSDIVTK